MEIMKQLNVIALGALNSSSDQIPIDPNNQSPRINKKQYILLFCLSSKTE